jgi:hypothetical protein
MYFRRFFAKKPVKSIGFRSFWAKYAQKQGFRHLGIPAVFKLKDPEKHSYSGPFGLIEGDLLRLVYSDHDSIPVFIIDHHGSFPGCPYRNVAVKRTRKVRDSLRHFLLYKYFRIIK